MDVNALVKRGRVVIDSPETMNLLGLLMSALLETNLADDPAFARARSIDGDVLVRAGQMAVTLRMGDGGLTIIRGDAGGSKARVSGTMPALLGVVAEGRMVWPFLTGKIRIGGNPLVLLRMLPLIRAKAKTGRAAG
jgi:hypothetical protein